MSRPHWVAILVAVLLLGPVWAQVSSDLYSSSDLENLVEPVALYPDTLLTHILSASTEPTQVNQAYQLTQSGGSPPSDMSASVQALMEFPDVLAMMAQNSQWTDALGWAVSKQEDDVLQAIQQVRARTQAAGNLESSAQMSVSQDGDVIVIQSPGDEVYVPSYDTSLMYTAGVGLLTWGTAVAVRNAYWSGACDWHRGLYYGSPGAYRNWRYGAGYPPGTAWAPRPTPYAGRAATRPVYNRTTVNNVRVNNYSSARVNARPAGTAPVRNTTVNTRVNNVSNVSRPAVTRPASTGLPSYRSDNGMNYQRGVDARASSSRGYQSMGTRSSGATRGGGFRGGGGRR